jgi:entry exclusion lipoprotein TrbK
MMKTNISAVFAVLLAATMTVSGCREKPAVASPSCAELEKISDPAQRAELLKKCPRGGPDFKPSPEKNW